MTLLSKVNWNSRKIKFFYPFFLGLILGFILLIKGISIRDSPLRYSVRLNKYNFPIIDVNFEGHFYPCTLNLGMHFFGELDESILRKIKKKESHFSKYVNEKGITRTARMYLVPKFQFGKNQLKNVLIREQQEREELDEGSAGSIGRPILETTNLLIDLPHRAVWPISTVDELPQIGYDLKKFTVVPFECNDQGIFFKAETEHGIFNFALYTCWSKSCLSNVVVKNLSNENSITFNNFILGNRDLGKTTFSKSNIPSNFGLDGILGDDFLLKHVIYIDFPERKMYIGNRHSNFSPDEFSECFDLFFSKTNNPFFYFEPHKKKYPFLFDLGSNCEFTMYPEIARRIKTQKIYSSFFTNAFGIEHPCDIHYIPALRIGKTSFRNIEAELLKDNVRNYGTFTLDECYKSYGQFENKNKAGSMGYPFLEKTNCFLDFQKEKIWFVNKLENVNPNPIKYLNHTIPFSIGKAGIIVNIETDEGKFNFLVDTGSTKTFLRDPEATESKNSIVSKHFITKKFFLEGKNFGEMKIYYLQLTNKLLEIDGILGMDFLKNHMIFVDYQNQKLLISDPIDPI